MLESVKAISENFEKYGDLLCKFKKETESRGKNYKDLDPNGNLTFLVEVATARKVLDITEKQAWKIEEEVFGKRIALLL